MEEYMVTVTIKGRLDPIRIIQEANSEEEAIDEVRYDLKEAKVTAERGL